MSDVSRREFEDLAARVGRIERTLAATVEMVAAEVVGLRTWTQERFDAVDRRFDTLEAKVDGYAAQVNAAMRSFDTQTARHERFTTAIAAHFDIDLDEPS